MSPDPFRPLDRIDPPEQWDEIGRRATAPGVDLDLGTVPDIRPRRRAAALVAAAAMLALVAGIAVAGAGGDADQDVLADDPSSPTTPGEACPFHLDPAAGFPELTPGEPSIEGAAGDLTGVPGIPAGTDRWAEIAGRLTMVTVGHDPDSTGRTFGRATAMLPDGSAKSWYHTGGFLTATAGVPNEACDLADVYVDISAMTELIDRHEVTDEEYASGETLPERTWTDEVLDGELTDIDATAKAIYAAIRLDQTGDDAATAADVCPALLAEGAMATATGTDAEWTGTTADGRTFTVTDDGTDVWVSVDGDVGGIGMSRPGDRNPVQWYGDSGDPTGITVGVRHPDAAAIGAVRPDGSIHAAGLVLAPDGTLFALPDMPLVVESDGGDGSWPIVSCTADGALLPAEDEAVDIPDPDDVGEFPTAPADPPPTTTEAPTTTTPQDDMTWEGPTTAGQTYRVEVKADVLRVFVDGVQVNADGEIPRWEADPTGGTPPMLGFELSPNPDGGPQDWIIVGARPPGATETFVLGPDGEVPVETLTISPDGRFYALHGLELDFMEDPETPWPVRHRDADGDLFPPMPE